MKESCWWVAESELPQTAWASNDGQTNRCYLLKIYIHILENLVGCRKSSCKALACLFRCVESESSVSCSDMGKRYQVHTVCPHLTMRWDSSPDLCSHRCNSCWPGDWGGGESSSVLWPLTIFLFLWQARCLHLVLKPVSQCSSDYNKGQT